MSAASRRGFLALIGATPAAAALSGASPAALALGRLRSGIAGERLGGVARAFAPAVEAALPVEPEIPAAFLRLSAEAGASAGAMTDLASTLRAIAALAPAFPAEIAAYRSFGAPMRRRLYAQMLERIASRLASAPSLEIAGDGP